MFKRLFTPPNQSYFLFGPRGTGKSTWLKTHYKDAFWIDLMDPKTLRFYLTAPEKLKDILEEKNQFKKVVIDEIQKVPTLLDIVHILIEQKKGYQFILTGSSARKLKKQGVNLLAGRALLKHMPPFFAKELGSAFNLEKNLKLGMLPIVLDANAPEEVLKSYVGIYLKEEVQAESIIRKLEDFARFLEIMSFSHGALINTSNIAREIQVARKTVDSYLLVLEDLLLSFHLNIFHRKAKRTLIKHPKFYYFDTGVYHSLRPKNFYDQDTEINGIALEGLVAQHLKAWIDAQVENYQLHFWQTNSGLEVDFILSGPTCFFAIEVKNKQSIFSSDLKGLAAFKQDYPEAQAIILYRGKERYKEQDILICPVEEFLLGIDPNFPIFESKK